MCGIAGILSSKSGSIDKSSLEKMNKSMKYRGPDDEGIFIENQVGLSHVRLSIIDLSQAGHQPMFSLDNRYVLVFNGEIYNYLELREELANKYDFKSHSDSEVLLNSYIEYGESCVEKFNGMFAFVIYDREKQTVFGARDRFGIKPLYYFLDEEKFVFASEIKPILEITGEQVENPQAIYDFLLYNRVSHTTETFYKNIYKLNHSTSFLWSNGKIKFNRYYNLSERLTSAFSGEDEYREDLNRAIDLTLRSDVPLGVSLSGGLDSSSIVSLVRKKSGFEKLHTFSAVYQKGDFGDESAYIDLFSGEIENLHKSYPTAATLASDLDEFVEALVEPVPGTSEYAEYCVMKLARKHCTVVINGQGPDEQLGGYDYFTGVYWKQLFLSLRWINLMTDMWYSFKLKRLVSDLIFFIYFLLPSFFRERVTPSPRKFVNAEFLKGYKVSPEVSKILYGASSLKESCLAHFEFKFEHHLQWADRSGMWFSLESRFPFLDHKFSERVIGSTEIQKRYKGKTKWIQRQAMRGIVPELILNRTDKVGYDTPEQKWFKEPALKARVLKIFESPSKKMNEYLNIDKCKLAYLEYLEGKGNLQAREIWKWLNLDLWFKANTI
jgi:asparagine synthase (glutamine-hydrolysing)